MNPERLSDFLRCLRQRAAAANWRYAVLLSGERAWCLHSAGSFCREHASADLLWLGGDAPPTVATFRQMKPAYIIGREFQHAVLNLHDELMPDIFAALAGTVRGGGLLLLLVPPWSSWAPASRFVRRFKQNAERDPLVFVCQQGADPPVLDSPPQVQPAAAHPASVYASQDQEFAVQAVLRVAQGHRRRPAVLIADRGRGKSAALGIAAAQLLQSAAMEIVLTAGNSECVAAVMHHAQRLLPAAARSDNLLRNGDGGSLRYVPPDMLLNTPQPMQLLLVDEAAALPVSMLEQLLKRHARLVFATTVHGYEGTGRGFVLQFQQLLQQHAPGWHRIGLQTPVRWSVDDPLEKFCFDVLLLDADGGQAPEPPDTVDWPAVEVLDQGQLSADETGLRQLFALLVQAHYRTRPADLRSLLDDADVLLLAQRHAGAVVGVAMLRLERPLPVEQAAAVFQGRRRLSGRITAQMLSAQLGVAEAAELACARVMRIAVLPAWRRRGVGSRLLAAAARWADAHGYDVVSASFGATSPLLDFWSASGFQPVYSGLTRDHVTGYHNAGVLLALSRAGHQVAAAARHRLSALLPCWTCRQLADMAPDLVCSLLQYLHNGDAEPFWTAAERGELRALSDGFRGAEASLPLLQRLLRQFVVGHDWRRLLTPVQRVLLVAVIMQGRPWTQVAEQGGLSGKNAAIAAFRLAVAVMAASCRLSRQPDA